MSFSSPDGLGTQLVQGFEANNPIMGALLGKVTGIKPVQPVVAPVASTDPGSQPIDVSQAMTTQPDQSFSPTFNSHAGGLASILLKHAGVFKGLGL